MCTRTCTPIFRAGRPHVAVVVAVAFVAGEHMAGQAGASTHAHARPWNNEPPTADSRQPVEKELSTKLNMLRMEKSETHTRAHTHTHTPSSFFFAHTHTHTHTWSTVSGTVSPHGSHVCVIPSFTATTPARSVPGVHSVSLCSAQSAG